MKTVTAFFLMLTTIMVTTALAAPVLDMVMDEDDCRICHDNAGALKDDHPVKHEDKTCSNCHGEVGIDKLNCMDSGCHVAGTDNLPDHHDLIVDNDCSPCHEKGVPKPINR